MDEHDPIQAEALPGVPGTTEEVTQTAAAFHVQAAMADESAGTAPPAPSVETPARNETPGLLKDVPMADGTEDKAASPHPLLSQALGPTSNAAASPTPVRTGTPMRNAPTPVANGDGGAGSRATSAHPDPGVPGFALPAEAPLHGAPVRQYINSKVTGPLLEGVKLVAKEQPKDPLRMLGEFLLQRSKELESAS